MNDAVISRIADAIAFAEGHFVSGSRPHRNNNPEDLEPGREALEHQVRLMFSGNHICKPSTSIAEVARHYKKTDPAIWALNVAAYLGVTVATRLEQIAPNGNGRAFSKN